MSLVLLFAEVGVVRVLHLHSSILLIARGRFRIARRRLGIFGGCFVILLCAGSIEVQLADERSQEGDDASNDSQDDSLGHRITALEFGIDAFRA